jgi:hypothetical protein
MPTPSFESIATITVTASGGSASVEFTSIPSTYTHLQLRCFTRNIYSVGGGGGDNLFMQANGDTANNCNAHNLQGNGASASASVYNAETFGYYGIASGGGSGYSTLPFASVIIDILDYKDTNKYKTARGITGYDGNGYGAVCLASGTWRSTSAITSLKLYSNYNLTQYSHFALYGIKSA